MPFSLLLTIRQPTIHEMITVTLAALWAWSLLLPAVAAGPLPTTQLPAYASPVADEVGGMRLQQREPGVADRAVPWPRADVPLEKRQTPANPPSPGDFNETTSPAPFVGGVCKAYGVDFQDGGVYFLDQRAEGNFTAGTRFEGCRPDSTADVLLVDLATSKQYLCGTVPTTPDGVPQIATCEIQQSEMRSGNWSLLTVSDNGYRGTPFAYERDFELQVGLQSTRTVTPTCVYTYTERQGTVTRKTTTTVPTTSTLPNTLPPVSLAGPAPATVTATITPAASTITGTTTSTRTFTSWTRTEDRVTRIVSPTCKVPAKPLLPDGACKIKPTILPAVSQGQGLVAKRQLVEGLYVPRPLYVNDAGEKPTPNSMDAESTHMIGYINGNEEMTFDGLEVEPGEWYDKLVDTYMSFHGAYTRRPLYVDDSGEKSSPFETEAAGHIIGYDDASGEMTFDGKVVEEGAWRDKLVREYQLSMGSYVAEPLYVNDEGEMPSATETEESDHLLGYDETSNALSFDGVPVPPGAWRKKLEHVYWNAYIAAAMESAHPRRPTPALSPEEQAFERCMQSRPFGILAFPVECVALLAAAGPAIAARQAPPPPPASAAASATTTAPAETPSAAGSDDIVLAASFVADLLDGAPGPAATSFADILSPEQLVWWRCLQSQPVEALVMPIDCGPFPAAARPAIAARQAPPPPPASAAASATTAPAIRPDEQPLAEFVNEIAVIDALRPALAVDDEFIPDLLYMPIAARQAPPPAPASPSSATTAAAASTPSTPGGIPATVTITASTPINSTTTITLPASTTYLPATTVYTTTYVTAPLSTLPAPAGAPEPVTMSAFLPAKTVTENAHTAWDVAYETQTMCVSWTWTKTAEAGCEETAACRKEGGWMVV